MFEILRRLILSLRFYDKYLDIVYYFCGIEGINRIMLRTRFPEYVLTKFGAKIGEGTIIYPHILMHAAKKDYSNLIVGKNCRILRDSFLDLTAPIELCDAAIIGNRASIMTHVNLGDSDLKEFYPTVSGGVKIGKGSAIGTGAIILQGVTIGECSMIGPVTLVSRDIPPYSVALGIPAEIIRKLKIEKADYEGTENC